MRLRLDGSISSLMAARNCNRSKFNVAIAMHSSSCLGGGYEVPFRLWQTILSNKSSCSKVSWHTSKQKGSCVPSTNPLPLHREKLYARMINVILFTNIQILTKYIPQIKDFTPCRLSSGIKVGTNVCAVAMVISWLLLPPQPYTDPSAVKARQ